jgi:hypothetical protein
MDVAPHLSQCVSRCTGAMLGVGAAYRWPDHATSVPSCPLHTSKPSRSVRAHFECIILCTACFYSSVARHGDMCPVPASHNDPMSTCRLDNGLKALVVQDTEARFAAACASVQAGYFDDANVHGLAHFLEHVVHLGSDKFPDERAYRHYLAQHGGSSNASTGRVARVCHCVTRSLATCGSPKRAGQSCVACNWQCLDEVFQRRASAPE